VVPTDNSHSNILWFTVVIRGLAGLSIGALSALTPLYLVELAPADATGFFGTLNQVGIAIGFVICYLAGLPDGTDKPTVYWWLLIGIGLIAPFALMFLVWIVRESPVVENPPQIMAEVPEFRESYLDAVPPAPPNGLFSKEWRGKLIVCLLLMLFQQTTGVNIILVNLTRKFTGGSAVPARSTTTGRWLSVGSSFTQVVTSMLGAFLIDQWGRRFIWTLSLFGIAVVLGIYAAILGSHNDTGETILIFLFISLFGLGCGPIPWFFGAETFPHYLAPQAMSIIASVNWLFACLVMQLQSNYVGEKFTTIGDSSITFAVLAVLSLVGAIFGYHFAENPPAAARRGNILYNDLYDDPAKSLTCC
jgi:MFS family permease